MGKTHVNFKLSEDVMSILHLYQTEQHLDMLTETLETLVREFWKIRQTRLERFKRRIAGETQTKPLEAFIHG
jgi:hypothetical protein